MSKSQSSPKLEDRILEVLKAGEMHISKIREAIPDKATSVGNCLTRLERENKIVRADRGIYRLPKPSDAPTEPKNPRGEAENTETINKMLNLFDECFDDLKVKIKSDLLSAASVEETINLIKSLRWLGATVDQLMKRWYLVHRGYDSNTKQAEEDVKQKTENREKQALESLPPEEQLEVVGDYDVEMRGLLESLPEAVQKEVAV